MIIFALPLRSKESSKNWDVVLHNFHRTIRSIFNQTDPDFRCIVACNQKPEMDREYDERLEFLELPYMPVPGSWLEMARDKFWKLTMITVRAREILEQQEHPEKGIYIMPVDADDLLHRRIAEYCRKFPNEHGFVSKDGYVWNNGKKYFRIHKDLHTYCGSCNIIKMYREDLPVECPAAPELCHDRDTAVWMNARYPIRFDHHIIVDHYAKTGRPFSRLPFRSTVYVLGTGDNISAIHQELYEKKGPSRKRFHPIAFLRKINVFSYMPITNMIRREFGFDL